MMIFHFCGSTRINRPTLSINVNGLQSTFSAVACSVLQGSVLGASEFICYTEDVVAVFNRNSVDHHLQADDKQLYSATTGTDIDTTRERLYSLYSTVFSTFVSGVPLEDYS